MIIDKYLDYLQESEWLNKVQRNIIDLKYANDPIGHELKMKELLEKIAKRKALLKKGAIGAGIVAATGLAYGGKKLYNRNKKKQKETINEANTSALVGSSIAVVMGASALTNIYIGYAERVKEYGRNLKECKEKCELRYNLDSYKRHSKYYTDDDIKKLIQNKQDCIDKCVSRYYKNVDDIKQKKKKILDRIKELKKRIKK